MFNFLNNIGPTEVIILVLILVVFFGGKLITNLARTSGETVKEIRKIKKTFTETLEDDEETPGKNSRKEVSK